MVRGRLSKNIYIDSSVNTHNDSTKVLVPSHPFSAQGNDRMSLTLLSFGMRRSWHNINPTNSIFYIYVGNTYYECQITSGTYSTFNTLATAINDALVAAIAAGIAEIQSAATNYNATTRQFTFVFTMAGGHAATEVQIRCFLIKSGALPAGVSVRGGYNDSFTVLGGKPIRSTIVNALTQPGAINTLVSTAPVSVRQPPVTDHLPTV